MILLIYFMELFYFYNHLITKNSKLFHFYLENSYYIKKSYGYIINLNEILY